METFLQQACQMIYALKNRVGGMEDVFNIT